MAALSRSLQQALTAACAGLALAGAAAGAQSAACSAHSGAQALPVVELYTSEGCSSCPPADRWLSTLKGRTDVLALAFHVDYWDSLGWKDRYASPAYTARQRALQRTSGARFIYTPQVLVNGADWRGWPHAPLPAGVPALIELQLQREGAAVVARVAPRAYTDGRLAGYWAVLEDGQRSAVQAGENAGASLLHDHVVRAYQPIEPWPASEPRSLRYEAGPSADAARPRRVVLVIVDAATARPLQALALGC